MKNLLVIILFGGLLVGLAMFVPEPVKAAAGINRQINFQGKIVNKADGTNITDGNYTFVFKFYDAASAGTQLPSGTPWTETQTLTVTNGIFRAALGSVTSIPTALDFNSDSLYLDMTFNSENFSTRVRMTSVPYAFNAEKVAGLSFSGTSGNTYSLPSTNNGTILTSNAPTQGITSTQTSGVVFGLSDSTGLTAAATGLSITLSGTGAFDQTGLSFNLSNASGTNLNDIVGTGSTWKVSKSGALTVASCSGCGAGGGGASQWQLNSGVISAFDVTQSLEIGGTATTSAKLFFDGTKGLISNPGTTTGGDDTPGSVGINDIFVVTATSSAYSAFNLDAKTGQAALAITQRDSGGDLFTASASSTTKFVINNTGSVGIGNSAPVALLDLNGAIKGKALTILNETGDQNIISASASGATVFNLSRSGGVSIFGATTDVTKSTSGTTKATDFRKSGSTLTNVSDTGKDSLTIDDCTGGTCSGNGTVSTSTVTTSAAIGDGGFTILREDGQSVIVHGGGSATASIWDGSTTGAMSASPTAPVSTGSVSSGGLALRRPDRRYLVVHGGGVTNSSLFDPFGKTATAAGPTLTSCTATTGTNSFLRDDGKFVIMCGGASGQMGLYDPTANTYGSNFAVAGGTFGAGAFAIHRDDGTFLVFAGGNTSNHWLYNPFTNTASAVNPITSNAPTINTGAIAIRRLDGKFLIVGGAANTSTVYDPTPTSSNGGAGSFATAQSGAGFGPANALAAGSFVVWRPDRKYVLFEGGANGTDLIDLSLTSSSQFTAGPSTQGSSGLGAHAIMRPDGQYQVLRGGASSVTDTYNNISFVIGGSGSGQQLASYETECVANSNLNPQSTLRWQTNTEGSYTFQVKTGPSGSCSGAYTTVANQGDRIGAQNGDNAVQVKVFLQRPIPVFADQDWAVRRAGMVQYRRINSDPVLYNVTVDNSNLFHRNFFDFAIASDSATLASNPSGPVALNLVNSGKGVTLAASAGPLGFGTTLNATNPQYYNGAFAQGPALATTASAGGILVQRPDRNFVLIGGTNSTSQLYNQSTNAWTTLSAIPNQVGPYSLGFKRPDGKFFVVNGNATTGTTIYDPGANTFSIGPVTTAAVGRGSQLISLPNGRILIVHGNGTTSTSIYNPLDNTMISGPVTSAGVGEGSLVIPRPNGTWLLVIGNTSWCVATTTTNNFDPNTMLFTATGSPAITTGTGPGAHAYQRTDGQWVIVHGGGTTNCAGTNRTQIYNSFTNQSVVGPTTSAVAGRGALSMPRPDGAEATLLGGATAVSNIYIEKTGAYTANGINAIGQNVAGASSVANVSDGALSFQRDDGRFVVVVGGNTTTVNTADFGWVANGVYKSEVLNIAGLNSSSTLSWSATPTMQGISAKVWTAQSAQLIQSASAKDITNGGLINPGTGETFAQVNFNFQISFPDFGQNLPQLSQVWFSGMLVPLRTINFPTLTSFKVGSDTDLLDLSADGVSMFRVNTNGDIFTSANAAINSGGADLAENYTSEEILDKGEVVSLDPSNNHGVKKSLYQYQPDVLGVVSTAPGFVAGSHTENSYPIALVGRVPVKVSTENGTILAGDRITASSVPGFAMKALKAGRVLGVAMENLDGSKMTDCPESAFVAERKCGLVMVFVNLTDYLGTPVAVAMVGGKSGTLNTQINQIVDQNGVSVIKASVLDNLDQKQKDILDFLREQKNLNSSGSEVFADRVSATNEILTPQLIADLIVAKKIKADSIEGLDLLVKNIRTAGLSNYQSVLGQATPSGLLASPSATVRNDKLAIESGEVTLDFTVMGKLWGNGGLTIVGPAEFRGNSLFYALATFISKVIFKDNVDFAGKVTFNSDTAGLAKIKKDQQRVKIIFDKAYEKTPMVIANMVNQRADGLSDSDWQTILDKTFGQNYQFVIAGLNAEGFEIILNKKAQDDLLFSWNAISVKDAKTFESESSSTQLDGHESSTGATGQVRVDQKMTETLGVLATGSATVNDLQSSSSGEKNEHN